MALEIDDAETEALIWELVALTGEPVDVAMRIAVEERLARLLAEERAGTAPIESANRQAISATGARP
ncbi:MAG: hypothetical protein DCF30_22690 [Hyphomicrobiales bacterium]|nr:MAG: hypothetical protein DCF30_22690 [Hyphomicrobiales bacterium]